VSGLFAPPGWVWIALLVISYVELPTDGGVAMRGSSSLFVATDTSRG
jgi:hypothetical protein